MGMICYIIFSIEKLCLFLHVFRRGQTVQSELESDVPSEEDKTGQSDMSIKTYFHYNLVPLELVSIKVFKA
jgi:hypothetical protein